MTSVVAQKTCRNKVFSLIAVLFILFFGIQPGLSQIPPGYYNSANGLNGTALQMALHNIIKNHTVISYTPGVWNAFYTTDDKPNGTVWDIYSDIPNGMPNGNPPYVYQFGTNQCGTASQEGDCYSREHSWPKSWFNDQPPMNTDLFHIYPTDQYVNNRHNNYPYGEVNAPTWTSLNGSQLGPCVTSGYTGTVFEPRDEYKGDLARSYFYMSVRYYTEDAGWSGSPAVTGSQLNPWALAMMMQWSQQDPVSPKEIDRNEAIFAIQHNRNPFIDHPEYIESIWNSGGPKPEPTNHVTGFDATTGIPAFGAITLTWIDATGMIVPDGYLVRGSTVGFGAITDPSDGTPVPDGSLNRNVPQGTQTLSFTGLYPDTHYYFKIYPYTNAGLTINYKTNGTVPSDSASTAIGGGAPGTIENPVTCAEAIANNSGNKWVFGYIVGTVSSLTTVNLYSPFTVTTNLALADFPTESNLANILYVQLPATVIRDNLNLVDNTSNYHKRVVVSGDLTPFFIPHAGLKNTSDYCWYDPTSSISLGYWNTSDSWNTGIPYQHDNVTIAHIITNNITGVCNNLTISSTGTQIISPGKTLTINGTIILLP
jgi:endonuclease I